jgi:hypothetical protein
MFPCISNSSPLPFPTFFRSLHRARLVRLLARVGAVLSGRWIWLRLWCFDVLVQRNLR